MNCLSPLSNYGIYCNSTTINYTVNVYNAFPTNGSYSTTFQINGIQTPPSTEQIDSVTIYTYNGATVAYDSCKVSFSNLRAVVINDFSASFGPNSLAVDSRIGANFTLPLYKLFNTFYTFDSIVLTFSTACPTKYQLTSLIIVESQRCTIQSKRFLDLIDQHQFDYQPRLHSIFIASATKHMCPAFFRPNLQCQSWHLPQWTYRSHRHAELDC